MLHARCMHVSPLEAFGRSPFTLAHALDLHLGPKQLRRLVARGEIRRVLQGVYVSADVVDDLALRAAAAALVAPVGTVVCGRTAAWLYGVDALAMGAHRVLPDVDLMVPAGRSAARRSGILGCSGPLADDDVVHVGAVPVTAPARTAADLARLLPRPDALASLDALLRQGVTTVDEVNDVLGRFAGYRGMVQARELIALASPLAESPQESRTRLRCMDAGFPVPEPQIIVRRTDGLFVARLDMGWLDLLRALEYDGDEYHSTPEALRHDRERREDVETLGWKVAVVTSREVLGRDLEFERIVAEALAMPYELTRHHPALGGWDA
jgi:hypothetical protein